MDHFEQFRPTIKSVFVTHHFVKDFPGFDPGLILSSEHFPHLHKFEENIEGVHIFRALKDKVHFVFAIDKEHNLILLRAFRNFKGYTNFLEDKKSILRLVRSVQI